MREIRFRGKRRYNGEWIYGYCTRLGHESCNRAYIIPICASISNIEEVHPDTVFQWTGVEDKNRNWIYEGDIVRYKSNDGRYYCTSVVTFGEYEQDGSGGEYSPRECLGFYVDVINVESAYDWNDTECFPDYYRTQSLLEVVDGCEVIGNIYDNYYLLEEPT